MYFFPIIMAIILVSRLRGAAGFDAAGDGAPGVGFMSNLRNVDAVKRRIPFRFGKRTPIPFRFGKRNPNE